MTQRIELKIGNVLDKLKRIESDSVDCIVTSCPYYGLRKYKAPDVAWGDWKGQLGLEPDYRMYLNHMLKITAELKRVLKPTGTLWWNMGDSYGGKQGRKSGWRDPKANSHRDFDILPQVGQEKSLMQLPTRLSIRMADEQGWILRNTLIWHKRNHMPSSVKDRLTNSYEYVFFFTKQRRYFFNLDAVRVPNKGVGVTDERKQKLITEIYSIAKSIRGQSQYNTTATGNFLEGERNTKSNRDALNILQQQEHLTATELIFLKDYTQNHYGNPLGKNPGDVLELSTMPFKGAHFAVFPPKLPEFCIKAGCPENGIVLDPFAGSGTTMMVARQLGRSAIGIELSEEYAKMIKQRLGWGCGLDIEWKVD